MADILTDRRHEDRALAWVRDQVVAHYLDETLTGPQCLRRLSLHGYTADVEALDDAAAALADLRGLEAGNLSAADLWPGSADILGRHDWLVASVESELDDALGRLSVRTWPR